MAKSGTRNSSKERFCTRWASRRLRCCIPATRRWLTPKGSSNRYGRCGVDQRAGGNGDWPTILGTGTEKELHAVLARGGVIGGSSAGATIQGSYLVRGAPEGNQIMMAEGHEAGFGFIRNCAIDQHVIARKRHFDLYLVMQRFPQMLGFGIDEATALVVQGDTARVIGDSGILVHNGAEVPDDPDQPFITLYPGYVFDLASRRRLSWD